MKGYDWGDMGTSRMELFKDPAGSPAAPARRCCARGLARPADPSRGDVIWIVAGVMLAALAGVGAAL